MNTEKLLKLIDDFRNETYGYKESDKLDNDMMEIEKIYDCLIKDNNIDIETISDKISLLIKLIKYKYGFEREILDKIPELSNVANYIDGIPLKDNIDKLNESLNYIDTIFETYISNLNNLDMFENPYKNIPKKEGVSLAFESLKSLVTNSNYRSILSPIQIKNILIDCIRLTRKEHLIHSLENKYDHIIKEIWKSSLTENIISGNPFQILISNINGGDLFIQAQNLLERPNQNSCSLITSNFIATYGSKERRIGFLYPKDIEIIAASAWDLGSNVFGEDYKNKELSTKLITPSVLEEVGIKRAKDSNEDIHFSSCYNEVLTSSKPCGIVIIGFGEKDINIDYQNAHILGEQLHLPVYTIDVLDYKKELSDNDKYYIAYHCIMSYLSSTSSYIDENSIDNLINQNQEYIANIYMNLKTKGMLNKENIHMLLEEHLGNTLISLSTKHK